MCGSVIAGEAACLPGVRAKPGDGRPRAFSPLQREQCHLGADAEAEPPAEPDALVHVQVAIAVGVEAGCPALGLLAQQNPAEPRPVDLPAVRVAAQNEVEP